MCGDSNYNIATDVFMGELNKLEDKLTGLVRLCNEVNETVLKQVDLIRKAFVEGETECEVDSLFASGTKIRFTHDGCYGWKSGLGLYWIIWREP